MTRTNMTGQKTSPKTETEPSHSHNQSGINGQVSWTCTGPNVRLFQV